MSLARSLWLAAIGAVTLAAVGCGLHPVELDPRSDGGPFGDDDIVVGVVPASALARLRDDPSTGDLGSIALLYPSAPALTVPANLAPITFEWSAQRSAPSMQPMAAAMAMMPAMPMMPMMPAMASAPKPPAMKGMPAAADDAVIAYELRLQADHGQLRLFTTDTHAAFPVDRWRAWLRDTAGGALHATLRALRSSGAISSADPLALTVWPATPAGRLSNWSTTAQGLSQTGLESSHEQYLTPPSPLIASGSGHCIGCHAVSRDGKYLLAAIGGSPSLASWSVLSGAPLQVPFADADPQPYVFGSFDPTAARIAVVEAGRLLVLDAATGQLLQQSAWPMAVTLDYPSWSPDGRSIALVIGAPKAPMDAAGGGMLARISVALDGSLGDPESLLAAMPDESLLAPSYSPDGAWLAFEKRKASAQNSRDGTIWIVAANGGAPIQLMGATGNGMSSGGANAPAFIPGDVPGRAFLLFASQRSIGSFIPADGQRQLFASALSLPLAATGADPSQSAFWLPFQQRTSSYLRVQWAPAVSSCTPTPEVCDGTDDDCDGRIDEDCCAPQPEICGDGNDNDCDGISDEGCGCAFREVCDNDSDDDCDGRLDEQPCTPAPMGK